MLMMTIANPVQSLAANLGAFMLSGAYVPPMPRGVVDGTAAFENPTIVTVLDGGKEIQTMEWRACEVSPIIRLPGKERDDPVEVDSNVGPYDVWDNARRDVHELRRMTESSSKKWIRKKAQAIGDEALESERRADKIKSRIGAAAHLTKSMEGSAERISWRAVKVGVGAVSRSGGNEEDVKKFTEDAALGLVKSGIHYYLGEAPSRAAEKLSHAVGLLFGLGMYDEAAIWAETAWQLGGKFYNAQAKMAAEAWLESARQRVSSGNVHFVLSHALQNAWSARIWGLYVEGMKELLKLHEGQDDYAGAAADYVRIAWVLLQEERINGRIMKGVAGALDNASVAWEIADMKDLAVAAVDFARKAEKIDF
jgi:hypothetical protein